MTHIRNIIVIGSRKNSVNFVIIIVDLLHSYYMYVNHNITGMFMRVKQLQKVLYTCIINRLIKLIVNVDVC